MCRILLDLARRDALVGSPWIHNGNVLNAEQVGLAAFHYEKQSLVGKSNPRLLDDSEFAYLLASLNSVGCFDEGLMANIASLVLKTYGLESFVCFMTSFYHINFQHSITSPQELIYTVTNILCQTIPETKNLDQPSNQEYYKAITTIYHVYTKAFHNLHARLSASPSKMFTKLRRTNSATRHLLSFVLHRLALQDAFSTTLSWRTAAHKTQVYLRLIRSFGLKVRRPMAVAIVNANIVRPLKLVRGLTRARAMWALEQVRLIEKDDDLVSRMNEIMTKWQRDVVRRKSSGRVVSLPVQRRLNPRRQRDTTSGKPIEKDVKT